MDPLVVMVATAAGQALVQAMTTDGWTTARQRFAALLGTGDAGRRAEQESVLESTSAVVAAGVLDRDDAAR